MKLFFPPLMQFFRSANKLSFYEILTINFKVNLSTKLQPEYCVPIKKYFEEIHFTFNYENIVDRKGNWSARLALLIQLICLIRGLIYIFWNEQDQIVRLYGGDLIQFFGLNPTFFNIPLTGVTVYSLIIFCLFEYSPVNQLSWLTIFNPIEGRQSFTNSKIFIKKSARKLIRFSLILITLFTCISYLSVFITLINLIFFTLIHTNVNEFFLYGLPWIILNVIWTYQCCCYGFVSVIIIVIMYYYELRLKQLDIYADKYLKNGQFNMINQKMSSLMVEYADIITKMNQFNKFASKIIFYLFFSCCSTLVFLIYNMIYVKIDSIMYTLYIIFASDIIIGITLLVASAIRIPSQFDRNKYNLIALLYVKNLQIKNRIKACCCMKMIIE